MGLCNLKHIEEEICKRRQMADYYRELLVRVPGMNLFVLDKAVEYKASYLLVKIDSLKFGCARDELFDCLRSNGIMERKYFYPLVTEQACFKEKYERYSVPVARSMSERILTLPLHADQEFETIRRITDIIAHKRKY